jgi:hypothetical protein
MQLAMPRLPKVNNLDQFYKGINEAAAGCFTATQVDTLLGVWPDADFDMAAFLEKNKEEGIIWSRAEDYFIRLITFPSAPEPLNI